MVSSKWPVYNLLVFGLWELARLLRDNPVTVGENVQAPHQKGLAWFQTQALLSAWEDKKYKCHDETICPFLIKQKLNKTNRKKKRKWNIWCHEHSFFIKKNLFCWAFLTYCKPWISWVSVIALGAPVHFFLILKWWWKRKSLDIILKKLSEKNTFSSKQKVQRKEKGRFIKIIILKLIWWWGLQMSN